MVNGVLNNVLGVSPSTIKLGATKNARPNLHTNLKQKYPDKKRIEAWVKKFEKFGTVENLNKKSDRQESHSGRKRLRDEAMIERVRNDIENSPKRSTRKRCQFSAICWGPNEVLHRATGTLP